MDQRIKILRPIVSGALALVLVACAQGPSSGAIAPTDGAPVDQSSAPRIRITAGEGTIVAQLDDTPTARSFAASLPLRLAMKDHAATEKVVPLPQKLSVEGAPAGADADVYDIAYYAPLGNFVMYYRDPGYFPGLVRLGHIQSGTEALHAMSGTVTIEVAE